ncbi:MAG: sigma-70 family RNA polymerase sigma factor [Clostridiales bacterium]|nr:sigma-70 family RNA polymerase sigma factor [Clostridiales bacterium]
MSRLADVRPPAPQRDVQSESEEKKRPADFDRDTFITDNLGLVHACCHRFTGRGVEYDDLYQAGCMGLCKAADGFDFSRGLKFSTYAVPVILGELRRLFRDGGTVKVGRSLKELSLKAGREKEKLTKVLGREPTVGELAEALQVTPEEAAEAVCAGLPALSLTYEGEDGVCELDLPAPDTEEAISDTLALKEVIAALSERDRKLITLRYFGSKTQTETAAELGMTQVQVSRREKVILGELRELLSG